MQHHWLSAPVSRDFIYIIICHPASRPLVSHFYYLFQGLRIFSVEKFLFVTYYQLFVTPSISAKFYNSGRNFHFWTYATLHKPKKAILFPETRLYKFSKKGNFYIDHLILAGIIKPHDTGADHQW